MNCPHSNTPNDPVNQFCVNCGQPLEQSEGESPAPQRTSRPPMPSQPIARSVSELLQVLTIRMFVILLGLWLLRVILNWLPFIQELSIPNSPLTITQIITTIVYLIMIGLLVSYSRSLWVLWPQALPRYREAGTFLVMMIYIIVLVIVYNAARPIILAFTPGRDTLVVFQVLLLIIALFLLIYAIVVVYQRLPYWLPSIRQRVTFTPLAGNEVACLNCGTLNKAGAGFCSHCGQALTKAKE